MNAQLYKIKRKDSKFYNFYLYFPSNGEITQIKCVSFPNKEGTGNNSNYSTLRILSTEIKSLGEIVDNVKKTND